MKSKEYDIERYEYEEKIQSIKKRKRGLKIIQDPNIIKKIKKDLKTEQRSAKRGDNNKCKLYIQSEIDNYGK